MQQISCSLHEVTNISHNQFSCRSNDDLHPFVQSLQKLINFLTFQVQDVPSGQTDIFVWIGQQDVQLSVSPRLSQLHTSHVHKSILQRILPM